MIYLLCGVPGSGKTWVIDQLKGWLHIDHDSRGRFSLVDDARQLASTTKRPIIVDCPFKERSLRADLEDAGLQVTPLFIVEDPSVIFERYVAREGKSPAQSVITRAETIMNKVREWNAFYGTSQEVLDFLRSKL